MPPTTPPPFVLGLAGGIGSGKSTVASALAELGSLVIDFDAEIARCLQREDVREELVRWWGPEVLDQGGGIDRRRIARIVFEDDEQRRRLEGLLHPLVRVSREEAIRRCEASGAPGLVMDAPLLFEAGLNAECDDVVFVDAPREVRFRRVASRGWDEAEFESREKAQMPIEEKRARSRFVLWNGGEGDVALAEISRLARTVCDILSSDPAGGRLQ